MPRTARARLFDVAVERHGFVTTEDAENLGIPVVELGKLGARGRLERVGYGIYRFPELPATAQDPYMLATLWAGGRGVLSHATALAIYELCDVNPPKIHLTVPRGYRPRRAGGELYVVHHEELDDADLGWWEGIRAVKPAVAIRQAAEGAVPAYLARQAIKEGVARGILPKGRAEALRRQLSKTA